MQSISTSQTRRDFIKKIALLGTAPLLAHPISSWAATIPPAGKHALTVLHTNDVHSRLDPFPMDGSKYQGMGGVVARKKIISAIREQHEQVLLLDAGDMVQGTPYYNFFKGEPEMKLMSMMGYDAATLGNHDFDYGMEGLLHQLSFANFPIVNCNYDVQQTPLANAIKPYTIIQKGKLRVGILGVGINPDGLIPDHLCTGIIYQDPIRRANEVADYLHTHKKCDYIICLSHLGYEYQDNKISDLQLARETSHIGMILGGHTHTFLDAPTMVKNRNNKMIFVNQVGWAGLHLGRINIFFDNKKHYDYVSNSTVLTVKETRV